MDDSSSKRLNWWSIEVVNATKKLMNTATGMRAVRKYEMKSMMGEGSSF